MNIKIALKSRKYFLYLDCVKLSLGILFFLSFLMNFFSPAFRIYLYFCQKHTPKSRKFNVLPNFTCGTDSCLVPWRAILSFVAVFYLWLRCERQGKTKSTLCTFPAENCSEGVLYSLNLQPN